MTGSARHAMSDEVPAGASDPLAPGAPGRSAGPAANAGNAGAAAGSAGAGEQAEFAALRNQLAERTADLQRITAEYANYRKRVDRDRATVAESATGGVLAALLPVLDDVDRARQHGDLTGAFKAVADQLEGALEKLGLQQSGSEGEQFDPTLHEAVAHQTSPDVSVPTCVRILRRGYRYGDRLLRPPLVAVADPEPAPAGAAAGPLLSPTDLPGPAEPGPATGPAASAAAASGGAASGATAGSGASGAGGPGANPAAGSGAGAGGAEAGRRGE